MRKQKNQSFSSLTCLFIVIVIFTSLALSQKMRFISTCPSIITDISSKNIKQIHPYKLIVKPWQGRHHVYGVFTLPSEAKTSNLLVINIQGLGTYCGQAFEAGNLHQEVSAKSGERIVVGYLRTRTALRLIALGFIDQLKEPRNWTLI